MNILEVLSVLEDNQVSITLDGNDLEVSFLQDEISDEVVTLLKTHKSSLVEYLTELQEKTVNSKIPEIGTSEAYPLSSAQMRMWILSQYEGASQGYNLPIILQLHGTYNIEALKKAILAVIERHEILRTVFKANENVEVYQKICPLNQFSFDILYEDMSKYKNPEEAAEKRALDDYYRPFDLENGPLIRVAIFKLADDHYLFYYNLHHIIGDGWSLNLLSRDVLAFYEHYTKNAPLTLPDLRIQYKDYAAWQKKQLESKIFQSHKNYWLEKLAGEIPRLDLPTTKIRPAIYTNNGQLISNFLDEKTVTAIRHYLKENGGTLFTFLLASLKVLLCKYTRQNDIIVGVPIAGRENPELEDQIGIYINTIALRNVVKTDLSFDSFYTELKKSLLDDYSHQAYPFDLLIDQLNLPKDFSRNPLFDIMVAMRNTTSSNNDLDLSKINLDEGEYDRSVKVKFDLEIGFKENDSHIGIELMYNSDVYEYDTMKTFVDHFKILTNQILLNRKSKIATFGYLTENDKKLLSQFNSTHVDYPLNRTILDDFRELVAENSSSVAVSYEGESLSYKDLDIYSNQLADYLICRYKVEKGDLIGIHQDRSHWMLVSILGILKSGGAYVPIDMEYPKERIVFIQQDSGYKVCLDAAELEVFKKEQSRYSQKSPVVQIDGANPAYAIFTSGSTGRPKGVLNRHESLYNRLLWMRDGLSINQSDVLIQKTPYTFDVSVWELLMLCVSGSHLVFTKPGGHKDPVYLHEEIEKNKVSVIHFVPSMLGMFLEVLNVSQLKSLKQIVCSGEVFPGYMVARIQESLPWVGIQNLYGPTEAAIDVTWSDLTRLDTENSSVTIGKPVANTRIHVVDQDLNPQAIGVAGELLIEGLQVASGYLNRPELSAEKFIESPFSKGERVYRTGDLCKWLPNGDIAYLGRLDHQVKIRGNRIELGEIEYQLDRSGLVDQGVVIVKSLSSGDKTLLGFVKLKDGATTGEVYDYLKSNLPEYMVPSRLVVLEVFPMTSSGKVNRKELLSLLTESNKDTYQLPSTELEKEIWSIWEKVLEHGDFGVDSNFFRVGGDSILSIRLISRLNKGYGLTLKLGELYVYNTIQLLIDQIETRSGDAEAREEELRKLSVYYDSLEYDAKEVSAVYPMNDIQRGMVYTTLNNPGTGIYHDQFVYTIPAVEDERLLMHALEIVVAKHETLRTSFDLDHYEEPLQVLHKNINVRSHLQVHDLRSKDQASQQKHIEQYISKTRGKLFDFSKAPLWQIDLFTVNEQYSVYVLQFHHSILDGWSVALFNTEFFNTYQALLSGTYKASGPLSIAVKDVIFEEKIEKENQALKEYWKEHLKGYRKLDFFTDEPMYKTHVKEFGKKTTQKLREYTRGANLHYRSILFGAFVYVLRTLSLEEDLIIGQVSNNRPAREDGDLVLGCFLNTLPLRIKPFEKGEMSWESYFLKVEEIVKVFKQKDRLTIYEISKLSSKEKSGENPFFDIIYNYTDFNNSYKNIDYSGAAGKEAEKANDEEANKQTIPSYEQTNTFLDINVRDHASGNIEFQLIQTRAFKASTELETIAEYVEKVLNRFLDNPEATIDRNLILNTKDQSRSYWHELLKGELPVLNLPKRVDSNSIVDNTINSISFNWSEEQKLRNASCNAKNNYVEYLFACWNILLHRYTCQDDFVLSFNFDGNPIVVRSQLKEKENFLSYFERLLNQLDLSSKHAKEGVPTLQENIAVCFGKGRITPSADLNLKISESGVDVLYNSTVYETTLLEDLLRHYKHLIAVILENQQSPLERLSYLTAEESEEILRGFNQTRSSYPKKTIVDLFEAQVLNDADKVAVFDVNHAITYQELNHKVERVASFLQNALGSEKTAIGVLMSRSAELPAILLGILKSGNAYIPIDPNLPPDRIQYILKHSETKLVIANQGIDFTGALEGMEIIQTDTIWKNTYNLVITNPLPSDTAYIIYTSGSTGKPKGVEVGHESLLNFSYSIQKQPGVHASDIFYAVTTYSFDISILEFFVPLISGATLYIAKEEILSDSYAVISDLEKIKPTIIQATPSFYQLLFELNWKGNKQLKVLCGGDALSKALAEKLVHHTKEVWNMYGPTETTIWSTINKVTKDSHPRSIGKPINNTSIYILDQHLNVLPKGVSGKLFIGGDGLAKGYFKNTSLTNERFIKNPFEEGQKIYDTGDVARWLPNGEIEFLGRNDFQVKIRGYRIELEEIQKVLLQFSESILQATITLREKNGDKSLVAYYTTQSGASINKNELKAFMENKLPYYMIPGFFKEIDAMPLNVNGKIDRKALPEINEEDMMKSDYVQPRSEMEEEIISIIKDTLGDQIQQIGIMDNFFDLGLDSLMSVKVLYKINTRFGLTLKPLDLFQYPNVQSLVDNLLQNKNEVNTEVLMEQEDISSIIDIF